MLGYKAPEQEREEISLRDGTRASQGAVCPGWDLYLCLGILCGGLAGGWMLKDEPTYMLGRDEAAGPGALVILHAASFFHLWLVLVCSYGSFRVP